MDCKSIESTLEKAYEFEREFDETRDARVKEFTRAISEVLEHPDAERRLNFISRLINDPEELDRVYDQVAPFLSKGGGNEPKN